MAASTVKILAVGGAYGLIKSLFTKIKAIDAKHGKFDLVLCTGDFFGPGADESNEVTELLEGKVEVPVFTYVMQAELPLPAAVLKKAKENEGYLCHNIVLLGKSDLITTPHGLRIASLGGIYDAEKYVVKDDDPASPYFTVKHFQTLWSHPALASTRSEHANPNSLAAMRAVATATPSYVDILLTHTWPSVITQFSAIDLPDPAASTWGAIQVDEIIRRAYPRYHFSGGGGKPPKFWEREPFGWTGLADEGRTSRFVSLGSFGEQDPSQKQRWFYAFSIAPDITSSAPTSRPPNATLNPFKDEPPPRAPKRPVESDDVPQNFIWGNVSNPHGGKRGRYDRTGSSSTPPDGYVCKRCNATDHFIKDCPEKALVPPDSYVCKICHQKGHFIRDCPTRNAVGDTGGKKPPEGYICRACGGDGHLVRDCAVANNPQRGGGGDRRGPPKEIGPDECWFCLSNPRLAKHLIVGIGTECYLTLPKGQLPDTSRKEGQKGSQPSATSPVPGGGHALIVPISHYPTLLAVPPDLAVPIISEIERYKSSLRACYARFNASPVSFEIARLSGKGGHAHVQVVPVPNTLVHKVEEVFRQEGAVTGIEFEPDPEAALSGNENYFRVDLPDGKKLVHLLKPGRPFNLQFGRATLASILGLHDRTDWKACLQSDEEDKQDAQTFKAAFAPFDFTL